MSVCFSIYKPQNTNIKACESENFLNIVHNTTTTYEVL